MGARGEAGEPRPGQQMAQPVVGQGGEDRLADRALDPVWELAERIGRGD